MRNIVGILVAIALQLINRYVFDASQSEGFITYLAGWVVGVMIYDESFKSKGVR
jgi:hypothetical protein